MRLAPPVVCYKFPTPYQYAEVPAGEKKIVWELKVTGGYTGFINKVSCDWYKSCFWEWSVDGVLIEKVEREVSVTEPDEFSPPIIARKWIRWIYYNKDTVDHVVGVMLDGELCVKKG